MSKLRLAAVCLLMSGCIPTLVENPSRDVRKAVPNAFRADEPPQQAPSIAQKNWKEFFTSPELRELVDLALKNNQELNVRVQEMVIAQNEVAARRGEYLPKLGAGLGTGVEKVGGYTSQGVSDAANGVPEHLGNFAFGLSASWEIDVWGKLRNAANSAQARYLASVEGRNFMVTQLVAEIARSYYELIALDNQLEVLERNIEIQSNALEVVRMEKQAARVTELAVQRFEAEVLKNRSRLFDLRQERVQAENRINFLVGRFPQPVARNAAELQAPLPEVFHSGVPQELLENRPDLRAAELELQASKLDIDVARAKFFPSFSVDARVGYQSFNITHLVDTPLSIFYALAGSVTAPLLNRAGIEADYRSANARQLQAVWMYEKTLLQSVIDVANQLVKFENLQKSYDLQEQQVAVLGRSVEVSNTLFQSARADYMEVLLTRRDSLDAQLELIETRKRLLTSMVSLYEALGGGWRTDS
ncbi:MAG: TolC family protein [Archangium sp.]